MNAIYIRGNVDGYDCQLSIVHEDNKYKCFDNMIDRDAETFGSPIEAFNDFKDYMQQFLEMSEENVDNEEYTTDFNFPKDTEERLQEFEDSTKNAKQIFLNYIEQADAEELKMYILDMAKTTPEEDFVQGHDNGYDDGNGELKDIWARLMFDCRTRN